MRSTPVRLRLRHARDLFTLLLQWVTPGRGGIGLLAVVALVLSVAVPRAALAQTTSADAGAPRARGQSDAGARGGRDDRRGAAARRVSATGNSDAGADATDGGAPQAAALQAPPTAPREDDGDGGTTAGAIDAGGEVISNAAAAAAAGPVIRIPPTDAEKAEGFPITKIEISNNRRVSRDDITTYMREKVGQPFKAEQLANDVHALWDSGFFDDIEVDLGRNDDGVSLRFLVRERPNIKAIEFSGNEEIENDKLLEAIEIKPNTILSVPAVRRSVQKIKDAYAEKGYFLADCDFKVEPQRDNEVIVSFKVVEHQPVTVRRVTFIGNLHVPDQELLDTIQTGNGGFFAFGSGGPFRQVVF